MTFTDLGLSPGILQSIQAKGYETPIPIQTQAIPTVLKGVNVMAASKTDTGETASFTLPLLQRLSSTQKVRANQARSLILTPTRELATQVNQSIEQYSQHLPLRSTVVVGGVKINPQMMRLRRGVDILVKRLSKLFILSTKRRKSNCLPI